MIIKNEEHKRQLRIKFGVLLMEHEMNLMTFCKKHKKELYEMLKVERTVFETYKFIYNRLHICVNIDLEFIQKLIDLIDKTHKVQIIRDKVIIGKPF